MIEETESVHGSTSRLFMSDKEKQMKIQIREGILALLAMVLGFGAIAGAQDSSGQEERSAAEAEVLQQNSPKTRVPPAPSLNPGVTQGLRVVKDPRTGILRPPTRSEAAELGFANRSSEGLRQFQLPGGGFGVNLQGRFRSSSIALRSPDGAIAVRCASRAGPERGHGASGETEELPERRAASKSGQ